MNIEYGNKVVITYNIDKGGNDITVSIRLLNRKEGNSMEYTYPIASVGGPVYECYENKKETIFNSKYQTRNILQGWVNDLFFILTIKAPKNQCQCILFLSIPKHGVCECRSIGVELVTGLVPESDVEFDAQDVKDLRKFASRSTRRISVSSLWKAKKTCRLVLGFNLLLELKSSTLNNFVLRCMWMRACYQISKLKCSRLLAFMLTT